MLGMLQPPQARPRATTAIFPGRNLIVLAGSVPESGFSRPGFSALRAEDEALRVLAQRVEHPVERARVALELLDQRVEARQGLVVERVRGDADFVQARRHPVESRRAFLQLARQLAEIGKRAAGVPDQRRKIPGSRLEPLGELRRLARGVLDAR